MMSEPEIETVAQRLDPGIERYECRAVLIEEDDGYSVYASRLPGVHSQGDTRNEAIANIREAFAEAVKTYTDLNREIPWRAADVDLSGEELWIVVDV